MTINIENLIYRIFKEIKKTTHSSEFNRPRRLQAINTEFSQIKDEDPKKQEKMISLVLGAMMADLMLPDAVARKAKVPDFFQSYFKKPGYKVAENKPYSLETIYAYGDFILQAIDARNKATSDAKDDFFNQIRLFYPIPERKLNKIKCLLEFSSLCRGEFEECEIEAGPYKDVENELTELIEISGSGKESEHEKTAIHAVPTQAQDWLLPRVEMTVVSGFILALGITAFALAITLAAATPAAIPMLLIGTLAIGTSMAIFNRLGFFKAPFGPSDIGKIGSADEMSRLLSF